MTSNTSAIEALMWEIHSNISDHSRSLVSGLGSPLAPLSLAYPPDESLTAEEKAGLRALDLTAEQRSGLRKLIVDASASSFFNAFAIIDGVGDPMEHPVKEWFGLRLILANEDDEDSEMLHDLFFSSWRDWSEKVEKKLSKKKPSR